MNDPLVPLADAAYRLEMSYRRSWEWLLAGKLRGKKKDGRWYVFESELPVEREEHEATPAQ